VPDGWIPTPTPPVQDVVKYWLVVLESGELPILESHDRYADLTARIRLFAEKEVRVLVFRGEKGKVLCDDVSNLIFPSFLVDSEQPDVAARLYFDDDAEYHEGYLGLLEHLTPDVMFEQEDGETVETEEESAEDADWDLDD
jgi:hypothetical protein